MCFGFSFLRYCHASFQTSSTNWFRFSLFPTCGNSTCVWQNQNQLYKWISRYSWKIEWFNSFLQNLYRLNSFIYYPNAYVNTFHMTGTLENTKNTWFCSLNNLYFDQLVLWWNNIKSSQLCRLHAKERFWILRWSRKTILASYRILDIVSRSPNIIVNGVFLFFQLPPWIFHWKLKKPCWTRYL